ncbi:MAG: urease accessory protein [Cytophagales bacterium]|nr:MAG: urease accessory protein [Cytophagales bacterium]
METLVPLSLAALVGFQHAFEADHLVAVSSLVAKRKNPYLAVKDGIYWGLGHTSTILLIGIIVLIGKFMLSEQLFMKLEAIVGLMLIVLGITRIYKMNNQRNHTHLHSHTHTHSLAYGVGAIHGLAGSGALILVVMTEAKDTFFSLLYLCIFGMGSIVGMLIAAGLFSLPFSKKLGTYQWLGALFSLLSSIVCILLGFFILYENIYGQ